MPFRMQSTAMPQLTSAYASAVPNLAAMGIGQQQNQRERLRATIQEFGAQQAQKREARRAEEGGGGWLGTGIGAIIGGIVGAVLAPFTAGASLGLVGAGGAGAGAAGGIGAGVGAATAGTAAAAAAAGAAGAGAAGAGALGGAATGALLGGGIGGMAGQAIKPPGGEAGARKDARRQAAIQSLAPFFGGAAAAFQAPKGQKGAAFLGESLSPYTRKFGLEPNAWTQGGAG